MRADCSHFRHAKSQTLPSSCPSREAKEGINREGQTWGAGETGAEGSWQALCKGVPRMLEVLRGDLDSRGDYRDDLVVNAEET